MRYLGVQSRGSSLDTMFYQQPYGALLLTPGRVSCQPQCLWVAIYLTVSSSDHRPVQPKPQIRDSRKAKNNEVTDGPSWMRTQNSYHRGLPFPQPEALPSTHHPPPQPRASCMPGAHSLTHCASALWRNFLEISALPSGSKKHKEKDRLS